jgi:hypothetical protein
MWTFSFHPPVSLALTEPEGSCCRNGESGKATVVPHNWLVDVPFLPFRLGGFWEAGTKDHHAR